MLQVFSFIWLYIHTASWEDQMILYWLTQAIITLYSCSHSISESFQICRFMVCLFCQTVDFFSHYFIRRLEVVPSCSNWKTKEEESLLPPRQEARGRCCSWVLCSNLRVTLPSRVSAAVGAVSERESETQTAEGGRYPDSSELPWRGGDSGGDYWWSQIRLFIPTRSD